MIDESQLNINSTETKLLFDIRTESRKTNEILAQILLSLCPIAKDVVVKEIKPRTANHKATIPKTDKPKGGENNAKNK